MEHNKEPELSLLLAPVHPPDGAEWEGQPEGGDQVDQPLPHHALAKLGGTYDSITGHQLEVDQQEEPKKPSILSDLISQ